MHFTILFLYTIKRSCRKYRIEYTAWSLYIAVHVYYCIVRLSHIGTFAQFKYAPITKQISVNRNFCQSVATLLVMGVAYMVGVAY